MIAVIDLLSHDDHDNDTAANRQSPPKINWKCPRCTVVTVNAVSIFLGVSVQSQRRRERWSRCVGTIPPKTRTVIRRLLHQDSSNNNRRNAGPRITHPNFSCHNTLHGTNNHNDDSHRDIFDLIWFDVVKFKSINLNSCYTTLSLITKKKNNRDEQKGKKKLIPCFI